MILIRPSPGLRLGSILTKKMPPPWAILSIHLDSNSVKSNALNRDLYRGFENKSHLEFDIKFTWRNTVSINQSDHLTFTLVRMSRINLKINQFLNYKILIDI